jgi:hypothetical protein
MGTFWKGVERIRAMTAMPPDMEFPLIDHPTESTWTTTRLAKKHMEEALNFLVLQRGEIWDVTDALAPVEEFVNVELLTTDYWTLQEQTHSFGPGRGLLSNVLFHDEVSDHQGPHCERTAHPYVEPQLYGHVFVIPIHYSLLRHTQLSLTENRD